MHKLTYRMSSFEGRSAYYKKGTWSRKEGGGFKLGQKNDKNKSTDDAHKGTLQTNGDRNNWNG